MSEFNLLYRIAEAKLIGRGGAGFPVADKWKRMKEHQSDKKYVVCNGSEGEPDVKKDWYVLDNFPEKVFQGMVLAMDFLETKEAYLYLNRDYYQKLKEKLDPLFKKYLADGYLINLFLENPSYIGGETGSLLNSIEGKKAQPRLKPPSPSITGINGVPVLLQNVETFYDIALVAEGKYENKRFVTINNSQNVGVFALNRDLTLAEVLKTTNNYPDSVFFVQVGGGASGNVFHKQQLEQEFLTGCASITLYPIETETLEILRQWADFYEKESCGKCTPCREGTWQIKKIVDQALIKKDIDEKLWQKILTIANNMEKTSICGLGQAFIVPLTNYYQNVWQEIKNDKN
jgi:NADH:ubiquinone oxidoreductase subunit F (NADH-binding)